MRVDSETKRVEAIDHMSKTFDVIRWYVAMAREQAKQFDCVVVVI